MSAGGPLSPTDLAMFERFRIPRALLDAAGVCRVTSQQARENCGIRYRSDQLDGIWFPNLNPQDGYPRGGSLRRDHPELDEDGRPKGKYLSPPGRGHIYFPPGARELLGDKTIQVVCVEAAKSSLTLTAATTRAGRQVLVIGTRGCWGWRGVIGKTTDPTGARVDEKGPLPDLDLIEWSNRDVVLLFDANAATNDKVQMARRAFQAELTARGASVRIGPLPVETGINGPDDFVAVHGDEALFALIDGALDREMAERPMPSPPKDVVLLPNDHIDFCKSAHSVFSKLAAAGTYFIRGGAVVELVTEPDGDQSLAVLSPSALRSRIDREASQVMAYVLVREELALRRKRCSHSSAEALLATVEARELLKPIRLVTKAPVIVPDADGNPVVLGPGYSDVAGGVLVTSSETPPEVELAQAVPALRALLADFDFATAGDESRALAALITPALTMGGWLRQRAPIDVAEADQSQAGKTLRQKVTRAIYNARAYLIAQREGGVGSMDESLGAALLSGRAFIAFDNLRGRLDSRFLEATMTWSDTVPVRVPHHGEVHVDVTAVTFQLSSNGVEATRDLVNRAAIVRNHKRPKDYQFRKWPEGDLLIHVECNATYYLGCVFAVIRAWVAAGRPQVAVTAAGFHDFREWAGALGWIVERLFGTAPLLEGHETAQARAANPTLSWLRACCLAAAHNGRLNQHLTASELAELSEQAGVDLPGLRGPAADAIAPQHVGKLIARCFKGAEEANRVVVEDFEVVRTQTQEYDPVRRREVAKWLYCLVRPVRPDEVTRTEKQQIDRGTEVVAHGAQAARASGLPSAERSGNPLEESVEEMTRVQGTACDSEVHAATLELHLPEKTDEDLF